LRNRRTGRGTYVAAWGAKYGHRPPGARLIFTPAQIVTDCNLLCPKARTIAIVTGMETLPHILIVDDDREIRDLLAKFLERQRLRVTTARDGKEARRAFVNGHYQLVVLDLMLPGEGGLDLARWFRSETNVPIIMLTAMAEETDRIIGLELGADDYVTKPFNPRELLARIRAVLRRTGDTEDRASDHAKIYKFSGWVLETARRRLLDPSGVEVSITGGEYDLLVALLDRPNRVLTRDMLLDLLRGRQAGPFDRAIDVAVSRLRRKLEDDGRNAQLIKTVRGGGYVLSTPVERL
jgi:two-component system, OmpR family, response regulator